MQSSFIMQYTLCSIKNAIEEVYTKMQSIVINLGNTK